MGVAVLGRVGEGAGPVLAALPSAEPQVAVIAPSIAPDEPARPTPSRRSDWPAAIGRPGVSAAPLVLLPRRADREEGTDGLMGGRPFGIPGDTPYPPREVVLVNRFTIDDVVAGPWSGPPAATFVRRVGGLPGYVVDPRER